MTGQTLFYQYSQIGSQYLKLEASSAHSAHILWAFDHQECYQVVKSTESSIMQAISSEL